LKKQYQVEQQRAVREFRRMATEAKPEHPDDPATHRDHEPVALGYWLRWCQTVLGLRVRSEWRESAGIGSMMAVSEPGVASAV
jgi:hypothetical protein